MPWYRYATTSDGKTEPLLRVELRRDGLSVPLLALVDSGADQSLLDLRYAELLGLDLEGSREEQALQASGTAFTVYRWPEDDLELALGASTFGFDGTFVEVSHDPAFINLLGRADFFAAHQVQFWQSAGLLQVDAAPPQSYQRMPPR